MMDLEYLFRTENFVDLSFETIPPLFKSDGTTVPAYHHVKPRENPNFLKNGKMVISIKVQNFSKYRMTKRTSSLESSREI